MNKIYEIEGALVFGILLMYAWTGNGFLFISGPIIMLLVWVWWWRQMNAAVLPFVAQEPSTEYLIAEVRDGLDNAQSAADDYLCGEDEPPEPTPKRHWGSEIKDLDNP